MTNQELPEATISADQLMAALQSEQLKPQVTQALQVPFGYLNAHDVIGLFSDVDVWSLDVNLALAFARALIANKNLPLVERNEKFAVSHGLPSRPIGRPA